MIHLKQAVVVEGKYDKIKLRSAVDAVVIQTDGFRIYKDKEKLELIRHYAERDGVIILTDSDSAGFRIRRFLKGAVGGKLINVYIPDIFGKEKRKSAPSKEGKLGVEGMDISVLTEAFVKAGIDISGETAEKRGEPITKADMYELGFSGRDNSAARRKALLEYYNLPSLLTTGGIIEILNTMISREEFYETAEKLTGET